MEYVRVTGDTQYDSPMFTALATASNGQAGSFLGAVPSIAALAGKPTLLFSSLVIFR